MSFDPNQVTFAEGEVRVQRVLRHAKVDVSKRVMTSQDEEAKRLQKALSVSSVPDGFEKWQLPFVFDKGQFFVSIGKPNATAGEHAHTEGDGIRFIMKGSIVYDGKELNAGDWMFIPKSVRYSIKVRPKRATKGYCYQCCCGGRADITKWLPDPAPFNA